MVSPAILSKSQNLIQMESLFSLFFTKPAFCKCINEASKWSWICTLCSCILFLYRHRVQAQPYNTTQYHTNTESKAQRWTQQWAMQKNGWAKKKQSFSSWLWYCLRLHDQWPWLWFGVCFWFSFSPCVSAIKIFVCVCMFYSYSCSCTHFGLVLTVRSQYMCANIFWRKKNDKSFKVPNAINQDGFRCYCLICAAREMMVLIMSEFWTVQIDSVQTTQTHKCIHKHTFGQKSIVLVNEHHHQSTEAGATIALCKGECQLAIPSSQCQWPIHALFGFWLCFGRLWVEMFCASPISSIHESTINNVLLLDSGIGQIWTKQCFNRGARPIQTLSTTSDICKTYTTLHELSVFNFEQNFQYVYNVKPKHTL